MACYSPTITYGGSDRLQAFTALGIVEAGEPFQVDMGDGFHPFRREVQWLETHDSPIQPLLEQMEFFDRRTELGPEIPLRTFLD